MNNNELLDYLKVTMEGLSVILGDKVELAVHDLYNHELKYICHGEITGRDVGYKMPMSVYESIFSLAEETGSDYLAGYASHVPSGKEIRASHIIYRDEQGKPCAMMCINQDLSTYLELKSIIDNIVKINKPISENINVEPEDENYIQKVSQQVILDVIEKLKPSNLDSKESRLEVIKNLDAKGIFTVKNAVPVVCKTVGISQATLYNYLREIRSGEHF